MENSTIFGPINSRRFGMSLGIDLSPSIKQCNFDCLYCELAPSATVDQQKTVVTSDIIINNLKVALQEHQKIDVITITANGEPTLYPYLDELIEKIDKFKESKKTLILTNSATLIDEKVFSTLLNFDQVKLSLDAVSNDIFKKIDRPSLNIKIEDIKDSIVRFSKLYRGELFIEILFVKGLNDTVDEITKLNKILHLIDAKRIDIGTIDRPPAYPIEGVSYNELHGIATLFDASLPIHIASRHHIEASLSTYTDDEIINTLDKRPLTKDDMKLLFDEESLQRLKNLEDRGAVVQNNRSGVIFYLPRKNIKRKRKIF